MTVANVATDCADVFRYKRGMANGRRFKETKPVAPMNNWVREAIEHYGQSMTAVADAMNRANLGTKYDRSKVQKMTVGRRVTFEEAQALSQITGYPLTEDDEVKTLVEDYRDLTENDKGIVQVLVRRLRAGKSAGAQ